MAKDLSPQVKRYRRLGMKVDSNASVGSSKARALAKRSYPPGIHGPKGHPRMTDYGLHLQEKQKVRLMYGIMEKQVRNYFKEAVRSKESSGLKFIELLERRLDNVIYRLGLATTRRQARQLVSHSHFLVNGKKLNVPSYTVKPGDVITLKKTKDTEKGLLAENLKNIAKQETPEWLIWDVENKKGQVTGLPQATDLEVGIDSRLIVEFYSR